MMKKLFAFLIIFCFVFLSCNKKKQQELEAKEKALAKVERAEALRNLKNVQIETYIIQYVSEHKENSVGVIPVMKISAGTPFVFVYKGKEHSFKLKNSLWGIKKDEIIELKEGYVKDSALNARLIPIVIEEYAETQTKEELLPGITKYPLTPVIILSDGTVYSVYWDLPDFLEVVKPGEIVTLRVKPTLYAKFQNQIYLFNSDYEQWTVRPGYKR